MAGWMDEWVKEWMQKTGREVGDAGENWCLLSLVRWPLRSPKAHISQGKHAAVWQRRLSQGAGGLAPSQWQGLGRVQIPQQQARPTLHAAWVAHSQSPGHSSRFQFSSGDPRTGITAVSAAMPHEPLRRKWGKRDEVFWKCSEPPPGAAGSVLHERTAVVLILTPHQPSPVRTKGQLQPCPLAQGPSWLLFNWPPLLCLQHSWGLVKTIQNRDLPGSPVTKTLHSQFGGPRFDPWLGN